MVKNDYLKFFQGTSSLRWFCDLFQLRTALDKSTVQIILKSLGIRYTQPGEVVWSAQFERALDFVRPPKTKLVRVAQRNVCSRCTPFACSTKYEPRNHSRFSFIHVTSARAECLTLMPGQSANADCRRAPGRHLGFTDVTLGGPFATPRARWTVSCL
jgi:hypothetical protein